MADPSSSNRRSGITQHSQYYPYPPPPPSESSFALSYASNMSGTNAFPNSQFGAIAQTADFDSAATNDAYFNNIGPFGSSSDPEPWSALHNNDSYVVPPNQVPLQWVPRSHHVLSDASSSYPDHGVDSAYVTGSQFSIRGDELPLNTGEETEATDEFAHLGLSGSSPSVHSNKRASNATNDDDFTCECGEQFNTKSEQRLVSVQYSPAKPLIADSKHESKHTKPNHCDECENSFASQNDLNRHVKAVHKTLQPGDPIWICRYGDCSARSKHWTRRDNFKAHVISKHKGISKDGLGTFVDSCRTIYGALLESLGNVSTSNPHKRQCLTPTSTTLRSNSLSLRSANGSADRSASRTRSLTNVPVFKRPTTAGLARNQITPGPTSQPRQTINHTRSRLELATTTSAPDVHLATQIGTSGVQRPRRGSTPGASPQQWPESSTLQHQHQHQPQNVNVILHQGPTISSEAFRRFIDDVSNVEAPNVTIAELRARIVSITDAHFPRDNGTTLNSGHNFAALAANHSHSALPSPAYRSPGTTRKSPSAELACPVDGCGKVITKGSKYK